jgi:hypothetical protein
MAILSNLAIVSMAGVSMAAMAWLWLAIMCPANLNVGWLKMA